MQRKSFNEECLPSTSPELEPELDFASRGSSLRDYVDANGQPGSFQKLHRVYDRADQPCATCRTPITRIVLGGRSTHFCPKCQA